MARCTSFHKIFKQAGALSLVDKRVQVRVCQHGCHEKYLITAIYRELLFPFLRSRILKLQGLGEFSKVMQTLDCHLGLHNCFEFTQPQEHLYVASYAYALWARHAIFLPHVRDEPKERLRRRLIYMRLCKNGRKSSTAFKSQPCTTV